MAAHNHGRLIVIWALGATLMAHAAGLQHQTTPAATAAPASPALFSPGSPISVSTAAIPAACSETSPQLSDKPTQPLLRLQTPPVAPAGSVSQATATAAAIHGATYKVSARLYLTGEAAKRESRAGWSHLRRNETNLVAMLEYHDYHLLQRNEQRVPVNSSCTLSLRHTGNVSIMPLGMSAGSIRARIIWEVPNYDAWETQVALTPNSRSLIGSPELPGGDVYLLSVVIR